MKRIRVSLLVWALIICALHWAFLGAGVWTKNEILPIVALETGSWTVWTLICIVKAFMAKE